MQMGAGCVRGTSFFLPVELWPSFHALPLERGDPVCTLPELGLHGKIRTARCGTEPRTPSPTPTPTSPYHLPACLAACAGACACGRLPPHRVPPLHPGGGAGSDRRFPPRSPPQLQSDLRRKAAQLNQLENELTQAKHENASLKAAQAQLRQVRRRRFHRGTGAPAAAPLHAGLPGPSACMRMGSGALRHAPL